MAGSAFNLSSGIGSDGKSTRATKTQIGHGFSAGSVLRYEQNAAGNTGEFKLAQANGVTSAEVVGVVESVGLNDFVIVYQGEIDTSGFITNNGGGITGADVWFLDTSNSGGLTSYAPTNGGNVVKPVVTLVSGANDDIGLVTNFVGTVVGGENTVSLSTVHPVGEIIPYGGETYNIPDGWKLCDGGTVDTVGFPEYYTAVGTKFGYFVELIITHGGDTGSSFDAGNTASQTVSSTQTQVKSSIISYTETGTTGSIILDPDILLVNTGGGETATDNTGYPHGLDYDTSDLTVGSTAYTVNSRTVTAAKTPDLRARTTLGAGDAYGTFDGYTAGQQGGQEDADTVQILDSGSGTWVYKSAGNGNANLRQPYLSTHYLTRISSMANAALIGEVSTNDDGITDHTTPTPTPGDIVVYGTTAGVDNYRNLRLFDSYPSNSSDVDNFENSFRISTSNIRLGIGTNNANTDIHIKKTNSPKIRLEDTTNSAKLDIWSGDTNTYVRTITDHPLILGSNSVNSVRVYDNRVDMLQAADFSSTVGVTGNIDCGADISATGQIYSTLPTQQTSATFTPDFSNGNVSYWKQNSGDVTIATPIAANAKSGAMYVLVLENSGSSTRGLTWNENYKFANGISPNLIRANSTVVVSMVCMSSTKFLCTWAEDFS